MFKYQIHKLSKGVKKARAVLLEDILTSDVFGLMSYLPYEILFKPFLEQVKIANPLSDFLVPGHEPLAMHFWKSFIWPENLPRLNRDSIEPDVVIEWPNTLLVIEAKFISATDPEELLREYLVGHFEAARDKKMFLLLIDKNLSQPSVNHHSKPNKVSVSEYIQNRIKELGVSKSFSPEAAMSSILWTNWQSFYTQVEILKAEVSAGANGSFGKTTRKILDDFLMILDRKGLVPFRSFDFAHFAKLKIDLNSLGKIGQMVNDPIPVLSNFNVNLDTLLSRLPLIRN